MKESTRREDARRSPTTTDSKGMRRSLVLLAMIGAIAGGSSSAESGGDREESPTLHVGGVEIGWRFDGPELVLTVEAPTSGWVAIGFNGVDAIQGADLFMMRVTRDGAQASHRTVLAAGDHRAVAEVGRASAVRRIVGSTTRRGALESSRFTLRIATDESTYEGPALAAGAGLWLIVAYSVSPDFAHHSRMRRHVSVTL